MAGNVNERYYVLIIKMLRELFNLRRERTFHEGQTHHLLLDRAKVTHERREERERERDIKSFLQRIYKIVIIISGDLFFYVFLHVCKK